VTVEWDHAKDLANQRKHGVSFEEANELFSSGVDYLEILDDAHSGAEDHFIALGPIRRGLILIIWTERHTRKPSASSVLVGRRKTSSGCTNPYLRGSND
jgi:uncharacterized DUF497 family protein